MATPTAENLAVFSPEYWGVPLELLTTDLAAAGRVLPERPRYDRLDILAAGVALGRFAVVMEHVSLRQFTETPVNKLDFAINGLPDGTVVALDEETFRVGHSVSEQASMSTKVEGFELPRAGYAKYWLDRQAEHAHDPAKVELFGSRKVTGPLGTYNRSLGYGVVHTIPAGETSRRVLAHVPFEHPHMTTNGQLVVSTAWEAARLALLPPFEVGVVATELNVHPARMKNTLHGHTGLAADFTLRRMVGMSVLEV